MTAEPVIALVALPDLPADRDRLRVETTTLLPGGGVAAPRIERRGGSYHVDDAAAGYETLLDLGVFDLSGHDTRRGEAIADRYGLVFDGVSFCAEDVSHDRLISAVAYVAEAARAWAEETLEARMQRRRARTATGAQERLHALLPGLRIEVDREVLGVSTKRHHFDIVVELPGERLALFESVTPNPNAVASAYYKFDDVKRAHADWPREAVVDRLADWPAPDLVALQNVASHIRDFESDWSDLAALAG